MRKIYLLLFMGVLSLKSFSQLSPSTIGEVYNFEVGDTFEYSNSTSNFMNMAGCVMNSYHMYVVLEKWNSADTLYYKMQRSYSSLVHCSSSQYASSQSGLDTLIRAYSNLDSSIFYDHGPSFCDTLNQCHNDTSYIDSSFCNRKVNRHFEGNYGWVYSYYDVAEGLGQVNSVSFNEDIGFEQGASSMIYSSKVNGQVCGTIFPFVIINEVKNLIADARAINISPNPTSSSFNLQLSSSPTTETYFILYDAMGRLVKREEINSNITNFHRNNLPSGIYFWQLSAGTPSEESANRILDRGKLIME